LGPIIEKVVAETNGAVKLVTVDVDANPAIAQAFQVQSIPAVFALFEGRVVDSFTGAMPEAAVREFVQRLAPASSPLEALLALGDEAALTKALALDGSNPVVLTALAELWLSQARYDDVVTLLEPYAAVAELSALLARTRLLQSGISLGSDLDATLDELLTSAKTDESARARLLEILGALGADDPRTLTYRRRLANLLY
jgi:putative thioredoxin